jgi:dipeptide/tripeptide permease
MAAPAPARRSALAPPPAPPAPLDPPLPPRRRSPLLAVCPFILGNELCERLAFYGLSTNLVIYLTRVMGAEPGAAAVQLNLFEGTCYLTPLLGAWLADSAWGRYRTILVFSVIYLVGMVALAASAALPGLTPPPDRFPTALQSAALYGALYIVALGTGGIKPNVSAFGADQFDENVEADRRAKVRLHVLFLDLFICIFICIYCILCYIYPARCALSA